MGSVRLATFNILNGRSPQDDADDLFDEDRYRRAITAIDADVLGLQEVDRNQPRSQHADLTSIAAEAMGAEHHLFVAALSGTPGARWSAATGEEPEDVAVYGIALLSRHPVVDRRVVRLPAAPVPVPHRFRDRRLPTLVRDEPRVAVVADVEAPCGRLQVVVTHLSFLPRWNRLQLRRLVRSLDPHAAPVVLMGDLNMLPDPAERLTGLRPLASGPTFPAHGPREQIDHVLADERVGPARGRVLALPMSDHCALVADL